MNLKILMAEVGFSLDLMDGFMSGVEEETGRQLAQSSVKLFTSLSNRESILSKISQTKLYPDSWNCSIFFTLFMKFSIPYTLEEINKQLVKSLEMYKIEKQKDCSYKISDICCHILPQYSFVGKPSINDFEEDYSLDIYPAEVEDQEIIIPKVDSVTVYIAPMIKNKIDYNTYARVFRTIENKMRETNYNIKRIGSFLYFKFDDVNNLEKMYLHLQNEIKKQEFEVYLDKIGQNELRLLNIPEVKDLIATLI